MEAYILLHLDTGLPPTCYFIVTSGLNYSQIRPTRLLAHIVQAFNRWSPLREEGRPSGKELAPTTPSFQLSTPSCPPRISAEARAATLAPQIMDATVITK